MNGDALMCWLEQASQFSKPGRGVTRLFLTPEHRDLLDWLGAKADALGLEHQLDDSGNYVIRKPSKTPNARTLLTGSHQDTVREGGKYDGMLGVLLPLAVLADLPELPFHVEIIAFGDEEGTRFSSTLVGSSALAGHFDEQMLQRTDDSGISMREALCDFGLSVENIPLLARDPAKTIAFLEVHIEQGPMLESDGLPVGVVTGITGIERHVVTVVGKAGHAGTTPMHLRQDALVRASQVIEFVDRLCRETSDLVGVVGKLQVEPNAVNVIPGKVTMTVELRAPATEVRLKARERLYQTLDELGSISYNRSYSREGVASDPSLMKKLATTVAEEGLDVKHLFSGAGHDGLAMAHLTPIAMLFVRCRDGLSHHPEESVTAADCAAAMRVLRRFILNLASEFDS